MKSKINYKKGSNVGFSELENSFKQHFFPKLQQPWFSKLGEGCEIKFLKDTKVVLRIDFLNTIVVNHSYFHPKIRDFE